MSEWRTFNVGEIIRARRRQLQLSERELARQAGVDGGTVSRIEQGAIANPNTATLQAIADVLGLSLSEIFAAGSPDTAATHLPALTPYLRTKYPSLPPRAVDELGHFFSYLEARYGEHGAARGDDER